MNKNNNIVKSNNIDKLNYTDNLNNIDKMNKKISVSYLDAKDVNEFFEKLKELNVWIHVDVMDNKFVNNTGVDMKYIKEAKKLGFYVDTHLMVEKPFEDGYIDEALSLGTDSITIHYEISEFELELNRLNEFKTKNKNSDLKIGVAVKPSTDVSVLKKYEEKFDMILLMSVEPGMGGQKYIESTNNKIKEAKNIFKDKIIQVDGGINFDTFINPYLAGADNFVMGSYFSKSNDVLSSYKALEILIEFDKLPKKSDIEFEKRILQIVPNGYGEGDILIGMTSPNLRSLANKHYKNISLNVLKYYINSKIHEHRKFALFCLSKFAKIKNVDLKELVEFVDSNIEKIDNWDLTDEVSPNVIGKYLLTLSDEEKIDKLNSYLNSANIWIKRIGIVSCLALARAGDYTICEKIAKSQMYDDNHLIQKAVGWVLREVYKKHPKEVVKFLSDYNKICKNCKNNKKQEKSIGKFVLSYACEKMSKEEKDKIKGI